MQKFICDYCGKGIEGKVHNIEATGYNEHGGKTISDDFLKTEMHRACANKFRSKILSFLKEIKEAA